MKRLSFILALILMISALMPACAFAEAAPADDAQSGTLRVLLKTLASPAQLTLTLRGDYSIDGNTGLRFDSGTEITVSAAGSTVWIKCGGLSMNMGKSVTIARHQSEDENSGLLISGSPRGGLYKGSLTLTAEEGLLTPILSINIEDYLMGVVPFEMSDSFPIEALKAQAVAARTYALRRRADRSGKSYDLVDTPADQVFYGYFADFTNAIAAVEATKGICGLYNGSFATCYYTATNGGQTARAEDILGTGKCGYLDVRDDPYDLENPASPVKTLAFKSDLSDAPEAFIDMLKAASSEALSAMGCSDETDDIHITAVTGMELTGAKFDEPSRAYDTLRVTYTLDARRMEPVFAEPTLTQKTQFIFNKTPIVTDIVGYEPGDWESIDSGFSCDLSVYDQIKDELGLKLSSSDCELCTLIHEDDVFVIQLRRYGHGVGMSQRGAQTMAGTYGMTYEDILAFYYPGLTFETRTFTDDTLPALDALPAMGALADDAFLEDIKEGEVIMQVALSTAWSTLNVRSLPSTEGAILAELTNGAKVIVMDEADGWAHVRTAKAEGYVSMAYLIRQ